MNFIILGAIEGIATGGLLILLALAVRPFRNDPTRRKFFYFCHAWIVLFLIVTFVGYLLEQHWLLG